MRTRALASVLLLAACSTPQQGSRTQETRKPPEPVPERVKEQEKNIAIRRDTEKFTDDKPIPKPSKDEVRDFERIWEYYRRHDPRWPLERDRYKRRSEAAGYALAAHLLRHYINVNKVRDKAGRELLRVKREIVEVGQPVAPFLVDMMVLDQIKTKEGHYWRVDDITRRDCLDMLERMGSPAVPPLLKALSRKDLGVKGRRLAALTLGGTRDGRAYEPLVRLLRKDSSWQVRADAATALGKLGDVRAVRPLRDAVLKDEDPAVVKRAGKARHELEQKAKKQ